MKSYGSVVPAAVRVDDMVPPNGIGTNEDDDVSPLLPNASTVSLNSEGYAAAPLSTGLAGWTSWWSVMFFSWCEYLSALCAERPLRVEDIWTLDKTSSSLFCSQGFKASVDRNRCVIRAFYATQASVLIFSGLLTLASTACELFSPMAVYVVVDAAANDGFDAIWSRGTIWTVALLVARFLRSFLLEWADFILNYALVRSSNPLSILLLDSILTGKRYKRPKNNSDEATNMFRTDVMTISSIIKVFHRMWSLPLEIIGLLYIFSWVIGDSTSSVFLSCGVLYFSIQLLNIKETSLLKQWLLVSDRRFGELYSIFDQILGVKLNAWQDRVLESLEVIRREEQKILKRHRIVRTIRMALTWAAPSFNLVATGVVLVNASSSSLNAPAQTFAAVGIFHAINEAFSGLLAVLRSILEFSVSLDRIEVVVPVSCRTAMPVGFDFMTRDEGSLLTCAAADTREELVGMMHKDNEDPVVITNASFTVPGSDDEEPLLDYISLRVRRGEFVVVHGKVGSGKSVLLTAIAGLLHRKRGTSRVSGSIAYCSQSPWIQSTTFRENVLFGRPFDAVTYWNVLDACELLPDIQSLPRGDQTLVGSRSYVSLSSGQQSRIALARACYADADLYVLDSPLDSVDSIVQCDILLKCFGHLLQHKTIILATHNPEIIVSEYVDRSVLMDNLDVQYPQKSAVKPLHANGSKARTTEAATPSRFVSKRVKLLAKSDRLGRQRSVSVDISTGLELDSGICLSPQVMQIQTISAATKTVSSDTSNPPLSSARTQKLYRATGWKGVVKEYLSQTQNPWKLCLVVLLHFLTQVLATCSIYSFSRWMSQLSILRNAHKMSRDDAFLASMGAFHVYVGLVVASAVSFFITAYATLAFSHHVADRLFRSLTTSLLHARMSFFAENTVGKILNRYCRDLKAVDSSLQDCVFSLLKTFFGCYCALFASLAWMSGHVLKSRAIAGVQVTDDDFSEMESVGLAPITSRAVWLSIMALNVTLTSAIVAALWYIGIKSNRPSSELFLMHREALSPIFTFVSESIAGKAVIRAFGAEQRDRVTVQFAALLDHVTRISWAIWCFESWLSMRALLMENVITGVLLVGLICFGHDAEPLRPATIGLLLLLLLNLREDIKNGFVHWNALEKDLVCLQRVFEYIHLEPEVSSNPELPPALVDPAIWPRYGSVTFGNVDFQYTQYVIPGHQQNQEHQDPSLATIPYILRDVSFQVKSGEKVGIVGRSGAGKSSIAMALLRVNNPTRGVIMLDGIDITRVDLDVLRSKVSYLPPNPVFCSGTIREYLDPFVRAGVQSMDDFTLWSALEKTGLKPSIRRVPRQLDASLDDIVYAWSNGERQLLCLARSLLMKARIVFLDEATTATDQETDFSVQSVVCQSIDPDTTLLCISHRIDAVLKLDKVLVVSQGGVTGFGTVEELISTGDGEFFDLLESAQLVY